MLSLKRISILLTMTLILFLIIVALVVFQDGMITGFDLKILTKIQSSFSFIPLQVPIFISNFGYDIYMLPQLLIIGAVMVKLKQWKEYLGYLLITEGVYLFVLILKEVVGRARPDLIYQKVEKHSYSFPSGHSSVNMFFYLALIYLVNKYIKNKTLKVCIDIVLICWIFAVGFSRVFLGVHYPSDVLAGYLVGIFAFLIFILFNYFLSESYNKKNYDKQN